MDLKAFLAWDARQPSRYEFDRTHPFLHRLGHDEVLAAGQGRRTRSGTRDAMAGNKPVDRIGFAETIALLLQLYDLKGEDEVRLAEAEFEQIARGLLDAAPDLTPSVSATTASSSDSRRTCVSCWWRARGCLQDLADACMKFDQAWIRDYATCGTSWLSTPGFSAIVAF